MKLSSIIMLLLLVAIVILFVVGYFTSTLPVPLPARHRTIPATTPPPGISTTTVAQPHLGKQFNFGNLQYLVEKTDTSNEVKYLTTSYKTSGVFLLVYVTVKNQTKNPVALSPSDFIVEDGQGRSYTLHRQATTLEGQINQIGDFFTTDLQPSLERKGVLVYDVPQDASNFYIRLLNGFLDVSLSQ